MSPNLPTAVGTAIKYITHRGRGVKIKNSQSDDLSRTFATESIIPIYIYIYITKIVSGAKKKNVYKSLLGHHTLLIALVIVAGDGQRGGFVILCLRAPQQLQTRLVGFFFPKEKLSCKRQTSTDIYIYIHLIIRRKVAVEYNMYALSCPVKTKEKKIIVDRTTFDFIRAFTDVYVLGILQVHSSTTQLTYNLYI